MPNALAHFGAQGLLTHAIVRQADPRWVMVGCVLPDLPWILHRVAKLTVPDLDLLQSNLYFISQGSLGITLLLTAAIALIAVNPWRTWCVLALSAVTHLLFDAAQTKWGNGVQLLVPWDWNGLNFGLFWPESLPTYLLTALGVAYVIYAFKTVSGPLLRWPNSAQAAASVCLALLYLWMPLGLISRAQDADPRYLTTQTLGDPTGSYVELDRVRVGSDDQGHWVRTPTGVYYRLEGEPVETGTLSIRGKFIRPTILQVKETHVHNAAFRNGSSYIGLLAVICVLVAGARRRSSKGTIPTSDPT